MDGVWPIEEEVNPPIVQCPYAYIIVIRRARTMLILMHCIRFY